MFHYIIIFKYVLITLLIASFSGCSNNPEFAKNYRKQRNIDTAKVQVYQKPVLHGVRTTVNSAGSGMNAALSGTSTAGTYTYSSTQSSGPTGMEMMAQNQKDLQKQYTKISRERDAEKKRIEQTRTSNSYNYNRNSTQSTRGNSNSYSRSVKNAQASNTYSSTRQSVQQTNSNRQPASISNNGNSICTKDYKGLKVMPTLFSESVKGIQLGRYTSKSRTWRELEDKVNATCESKGTMGGIFLSSVKDVKCDDGTGPKYSNSEEFRCSVSSQYYCSCGGGK